VGKQVVCVLLLFVASACVKQHLSHVVLLHIFMCVIPCTNCQAIEEIVIMVVVVVVVV
jgi:hypothetical protein